MDIAADPGTVRGEALSVPNSAGTAPPRHAVPAGAADCHFHVFDRRFPRPAGELTTIGTVSDYRLFRRRLGLARSVVVAPSTYGMSNDCLLDALAAFGDTARGVAIVPPGVEPARLRALHEAGVRGVRVYLGKGEPLTAAELRALAAAIAPLGWHMEVVVSHHTSLLLEAELVLASLPCPLVVDHFGFVQQPGAMQEPAYAALLRLLEAGRCWVKLSGVYHVSAGMPGFADVDPLARDLVARGPERMLWGSDWPHTGARSGKPDGAALLDQLWDWTDETTLHRILVDNPTHLYWPEP